MKTTLIAILSAFLALTLGCLLGLMWAMQSISTSAELPPNFEQLLNTTYGESPYKLTRGDLVMDIENASQQKYYIKYSWFTYDQSNFNVTLYVSSQSKTNLSLTTPINAVLHIGEETLQLMTAPSLIDYPADTPLGYKQKIFLTFPPLAKDYNTFTLDVVYGEDTFIFQDIPIK